MTVWPECLKATRQWEISQHRDYEGRSETLSIKNLYHPTSVSMAVISTTTKNNLGGTGFISFYSLETIQREVRAEFTEGGGHKEKLLTAQPALL